MFALFVFVLYTVTAVLGEDNFYLHYPLENDLVPTDSFEVIWEVYGTFYDDQFTLAVSYSDGAFTTLTTVPASDSATVLPASFLPAMRPDETSNIEFGVYISTTSGDRYGIWITSVSMYAPTPTPETVTVTEPGTSRVVTVTKTPTPTRTPATSGEHSASEAKPSGADETKQGGGTGLSTGAKAGIGVGVGVGALILAGVGFFFVRQRRRKYESVAFGAPRLEATENQTTKGGRE